MANEPTNPNTQARAVNRARKLKHATALAFRVAIPAAGLALIYTGASRIYPPAGPLAVGILLWADSTFDQIRRLRSRA